MREGYTLVWWGWEMDATPGWNRVMMPKIVARNPDGAPITGVVRSEIITPHPTTTVPISLSRADPALPVRQLRQLPDREPR